ncbi:MAG: hypothetical protein AAGC77_04415 [Pseudomonadota bacterium]
MNERYEREEDLPLPDDDSDDGARAARSAFLRRWLVPAIFSAGLIVFGALLLSLY